MAIKYILSIALIIALSGCAGIIRQHTEDLLLYQQRIMLNIVSILSNDDYIDYNVETTLYYYEDRIGEDCRALQQALIYKINGNEITTELKSQIFNNLDICENTVQEAEVYLINNKINYW